MPTVCRGNHLRYPALRAAPGQRLAMCKAANSSAKRLPLCQPERIVQNIRKGDFARSKVRGKRALELGAGMGLAGERVGRRRRGLTVFQSRKKTRGRGPERVGAERPSMQCKTPLPMRRGGPDPG